jgi:hypothetical protein
LRRSRTGSRVASRVWSGGAEGGRGERGVVDDLLEAHKSCKCVKGITYLSKPRGQLDERLRRVGGQAALEAQIAAFVDVLLGKEMEL